MTEAETPSWQYSLLDEPWIQVLDDHGERRELGIIDVFTHVNTLRSLDNESVIQNVAIMRLLIAITYRALDPVLKDDWMTWYPDGFPSDKVVAYLQKHRNLFNMFDDKHPFLQEPDIVPNKGIEELGASGLMKNELSGDGALFAFRRGDAASVLSFPEACRRLVTSMQFEVKGIHSSYQGASAVRPVASKTLTASSSMVWMQEDNLALTLLMNTIPLDSDVFSDLTPDAQGNLTAGIPSWELGAIGAKQFNNKAPVAPQSVMDVLTWRNRRMHIYDAGDCVRNAIVTEGIPMDVASALPYDTMSAWESGVNKKSEPYIRPLRYYEDQERQYWKGLRSFIERNFGSSNKNVSPARVISWGEELMNDGVLPSSHIADTNILTLVYDSNGSSLKNAIHDYVPIPIHDVNDDDARQDILNAMKVAQEVGLAYGAFIISCRMSMGERPLNETSYTARETAGASLYARMEPLFYEWIQGDKDMGEWFHSIQRTTLDAAEEYMKSLPVSAYYGKMVDNERFSAAKALNILKGILHKKKKEIS
jgi:CRISPR system Cascade subunit CasA